MSKRTWAYDLPKPPRRWTRAKVADAAQTVVFTLGALAAFFMIFYSAYKWIIGEAD